MPNDHAFTETELAQRWRNTEPNPRSIPEPDSNALALRAWIRRLADWSSTGRISSCYLAPAVVERKGPGMADGVLNSEHAGLSWISCALDHV